MALTFNTGRLAQSGGERKSCSWTAGQQPSRSVPPGGKVRRENHRALTTDEDRNELNGPASF